MGGELVEIKNQHVVITGANRGIGLAFAKACAQQGAHLTLVMRTTELQLVDELKALGSPNVNIIAADLVTRSEVERLAQQLNTQKIDLLFNNAGLLTGGLIEEQTLDDIYNVVQVNVSALIHLSRAVLPQMIKQKSGKIINHASVSAIMHFPCASTYAATKAAVWAFTDCLQQELKNTGVSTLCLFTPGIKTRMFDKIEDLYSKNFEAPQSSISPDEYALKIINAVKTDQVYLEPRGWTGFALMLAQNFKSIFNWLIAKKFKR